MKNDSTQHGRSFPDILSILRDIADGEKTSGNSEAAIERQFSSRYRASLSQERILFSDQFEPSGSSSNISIGMRISGDIDTLAIENSLQTLVKRHETLRTAFSIEGGEYIASVFDYEAFQINYIDVAHLKLDEAEKEARAQALQELKNPFDLSKPPLIRANLYRLDTRTHVLLFIIHHAISDGPSEKILLGEFWRYYQSYLKEDVLQIVEPLLQYSDFAIWQRKELEAGAYIKGLSYWKDSLQGGNFLSSLPDAFSSNADHIRSAGHFPIRISSEMRRSLKRLGQENDATTFMVILTAFSLLIARISGQKDVVIGIPAISRPSELLNSIVGCFLNVLPIRVNIGENPPFRELLSRVSDTCLSALTHQDVPFQSIVEDIQPERVIGRNPLYQVQFSYAVGSTGSATDSSTLIAEPWEVGGSTYQGEMNLMLNERESEIEGSLLYATDLFDRESMERLAGAFHLLLEGIVSAPDRRVSEFPLVSAAERQRLVVDWNATGSAYPREL
ncbi:condensation domain-containing protein, partial [Rhizobium leguminosarum]|uniref:condensation domain-containing protein n=1 Tax=Rhizobium leguminosarum TaxID=384 RepID=UPI003F9AF037